MYFHENIFWFLILPLAVVTTYILSTRRKPTANKWLCTLNFVLCLFLLPLGVIFFLSCMAFIKKPEFSQT